MFLDYIDGTSTAALMLAPRGDGPRFKDAYIGVNTSYKFLSNSIAYDFKFNKFSSNPSITFEMCRDGGGGDFVKNFVYQIERGSVFSTKPGQSTFYESRGNPAYKGGMQKTTPNGIENHDGNTPESSPDKGEDNILFNPRF